MMRRILLLVSAATLAAFAQKYNGPRPDKPDLIYIKHADHLVATEVVTAREEKKKNETIYDIDGANSSARTPLVLPVFLLLADKLNPDRLGLKSHPVSVDRNALHITLPAMSLATIKLDLG